MISDADKIFACFCMHAHVFFHQTIRKKSPLARLMQYSNCNTLSYAQILMHEPRRHWNALLNPTIVISWRFIFPPVAKLVLAEWRDEKTVCVGGAGQTDGAKPFL